MVLMIAGALQTWGAQLPGSLKEALRRVDNELASAPRGSLLREARLDSLKARLVKAPARDSVRLIAAIAGEYDSYNVDSCVRYFHRGMEVAARQGDSVMEQRMSFNRLSRLPLLGLTRESVDGFNQFRGKIYPENRLEFFEAGNRMMLYTADLYPPSRIRDTYVLASLQLGDSLIKYLPEQEPLRKLLLAQRAGYEGDEATLVAHLTDLLEQLPEDNNIFARAAARLGEHYAELDNKERAAYYYALSAASDIHTATLEGVALLRLGNLMYSMGETGDAFRYSNEALAASSRSGSRIRALEGFQTLPAISEAFREEDHKRMMWLFGLMACLLVALLVIISVHITGRRRLRRLHILKGALEKANADKEKNIGAFIELASIYADKLEELTRLASRKITAGQVEDLLRLLKSGSISAGQTKIFCKMFDNAFLHLYPTFVEDVNALLKEDRKVRPEPAGELTAELRILAFMRLGIDDSARVAKFMGMSLNTVYTYRNRMKARALERESFERSVMAIGSVGSDATNFT